MLVAHATNTIFFYRLFKRQRDPMKEIIYYNQYEWHEVGQNLVGLDSIHNCISYYIVPV